MAPEPDARLSFPDGPKLELDELIDQLVDRAQDVKRAQGRLRSLLRAIEVVTGELALESVLRHIVEAACDLAGARYGALGVIAHDGGLEQFIHAGLGPEEVARIGPLPQGKGLLGALISDPSTIRLEHLGEDPRSAGFPSGHPPMDSFLGVPIRVRGEVFGNLYLTESSAGRFSEEDEQLVRALAVTAGTAISNARLYQESRTQQLWLSASVEIGSQMLADTGEDPLRMIARHAQSIASADLVTVALVAGDGAAVVVEVAVGERAEGLLGMRVPLAGSVAGLAITQRSPVLLRALADSEQISGLDTAIDVGPLMALPMAGSTTVFGVLTIARRAGRPTFTSAELAMAAAFAANASVAHELGLARADQQRVVLLEDRDRIARDLHDHVIQQLFAIGLSLEGTAACLRPDDPAVAKIHDRVNDLDATIRQIRTSIFELRGSLAVTAVGLRQRLMAVVHDLAPALGFTPGVAFSGTLDSSVTGELADDVEATVREGLTNVLRHAQATRADVVVAAADARLRVEIRDDGVGIGVPRRSSGLANLETRARRHGGGLHVGGQADRGTTVIWEVALP